MSTNNKSAGTSEKRTYEGPVAWLLGRQLMGSLKGTLLYTAFGNKIDPRDWMEADVFKQFAHFGEQPGEDEFWFDYIADTGDGMKATYSVAYLSAGDLWVDPKHASSLKQPPEPSDKTLDVAMGNDPSSGKALKLPRGSFLMIGGDTTYHLADYPSLSSRFQNPFKWAAEDRKYDGPKKVRPLYGIPGNHDYYDLLDGFRRQFRHPVRPDNPFPARLSDAEIRLLYAKLGGPQNLDPLKPDSWAQLSLSELERSQRASYFAIHLPWKWWLWGLDTEVGAIDERQRAFFTSSGSDDSSEQKPPDKLIVATCAPTTVFGKYARWKDKKSSRTFSQLGLRWHFWTGYESEKILMDEIEEEALQTEECDAEINKTKADLIKLLPEQQNEAEVAVKDNQCRLDISGDVHLYARYFGPESHPKSAKKRRRSDHYASVVSGGGGAFHHPSFTSVNEISEQVLYPSKERSIEEVSRRLFDFWGIWRGGSVWLLGFVIAFTFYFAATYPGNGEVVAKHGTRWLKGGVDVVKGRLLSFVGQKSIPSDAVPDPSQETQTAPDEAKPATATAGHRPRSRYYEQVAESIYDAATPVKAILDWYRSWSPGTKGLVGGISLLLPLIGLIVAVRTSRRFFRVRRKVPPENESPDNRLSRASWRFGKLVGYVLLSLLLVAFGFDCLRQIQSFLDKFVSSLLVVYALGFGIACIVFCLQYSEWLFENARIEIIRKRDWRLVWVVAVFGVIGVSSGLWYFGRHSPYVYVFSDIFFFLVTAGTLVGLTLMAWNKGGEMLTRWEDMARILFVGLWHALLQILTPFMIVGFFTWVGTILVIIASVGFYFLGRWCLTNKHYWTLSAAWVSYGLLVLFIPMLVSSNEYVHFVVMESPGIFGGFVAVGGAATAGAVGAIFSCIWFGWYLAICFLCFDGHNNEVGGAARIEGFKQFIRFRLTENTITGYVIAVDDVDMIGKPIDKKEGPWKDGSFLNPKLIDVFQLRVKGTAE